MTVTPATSDPRPVPPKEPQLEECCGSGCDPCIYDLYVEALERYEGALKAWEERASASAPRGDA